LVPRKGKFTDYDEVLERIEELEKSLDGELAGFEKKLGCAQTRVDLVDSLTMIFVLAVN
jgi:hypothetical protein